MRRSVPKMLSSENNQYCEPFDNSLVPEAAKGRFIELIRQNPVIYDSKYAKKSAANSRNIARARKSAWEVIGKEMKQTPEECKKKWKSIRDCYVRCTKSGGQSVYSNVLSFLNDHVDLTKKKSSDTKTSGEKNDKILVTLDMVQSLVKDIPDDEDNDAVVEATSDVLNSMFKKSLENKKNDKILVTLDVVRSLVKEKSDDEDNDALVEATSDVLSSMFKKSLEETINKFTEPSCSAQRSSTFQHPNEYHKEVEADEKTVECCSGIMISDVVSLSTKAIKSEIKDSTEVNTLKRKLQDSNETEITNSKTLKTELAESSKQQLDIPLFFKEIGEYVAAYFPFKKQMELRLKVLSLVTEAELELLHGEDE